MFLNYLSMGLSFGLDSETVWTRCETGDRKNILEYVESASWKDGGGSRELVSDYLCARILCTSAPPSLASWLQQTFFCFSETPSYQGQACLRAFVLDLPSTRKAPCPAAQLSEPPWNPSLTYLSRPPGSPVIPYRGTLLGFLQSFGLHVIFSLTHEFV